MALKPVKGKIQSQELNDNFSYLDSNKRGLEKIEPEDFSERSLELVTGEGEINLLTIPEDKSVDVSKLDEKIASNFKIDFELESGSLNGTTGNIQSNVSRLRTTKMIKVKQGNVIKLTDNEYKLRIYFYDLNGNYIDNTGTWDDSYIIESEAFVKVTVYKTDQSTGDISNKINYVESVLYIEYPQQMKDEIFRTKQEIKNITDFYPLKNKALKPNQMSFLKKNEKNIFNSIFYNGYLSGEAPYAFNESENGIYALVKVEPEKDYAVYKSKDTNRFRLGLFTETPKQNDIPNSIDFKDNNEIIELRTGPNDNYLIIVVSSTSENKTPDKLQVEKGNFTKYEEPYRLSGVELKKDKKITVPTETYSNSTSFITPFRAKNKLEDAYALWDNLMAEYPNYITKSLLAEDAIGLPIYRYDFKPLNTRVLPPVPVPPSEDLKKVIYLGGIHGNERGPTMMDFRFFKDLTENTSNNSILNTLNSNVHFIVVPIQCPSGYNEQDRVNSNGVNINRNFPTGWEQTSEGENYSGPFPMSEIETQIIHNLLLENNDADLVIDSHNTENVVSGSKLGYLRVTQDDKFLARLVSVFYRNIETKFRKEYLKIEEEIPYFKDSMYYAIGYPANSGTLSMHYKSIGIRGVLSEKAETFGIEFEYSEEELQNIAVDFTGNLIYSVIINS